MDRWNLTAKTTLALHHALKTECDFIQDTSTLCNTTDISTPVLSKRLSELFVVFYSNLPFFYV